MFSTDTSVEQKNKAVRITRFRTLMATGTGFIPIPILDAAGILTIQIWMIRDLARVYGIPFKKHIAKSLIGALVGNISSAGVIKFIPGLGGLLGGGAVAVSGGAATYALGKIFTQHFDQGGTLLTFDPIKSRDYFKELYDQGKNVPAGLENEQGNWQSAHVQLQASAGSLQKAHEDLTQAIASLKREIESSNRLNTVSVSMAQPKKRRWLRRIFLVLLLLLASFGAWRYVPRNFIAKSASLVSSALGDITGSMPHFSSPAVGDSTKTDVGGVEKNTESPAIAQPNPGAAAFGFASGTSEALLADSLSNPASTYPQIIPLQAVLFEEGSSALTPDAMRQVSNIARLLKKYPAFDLTISGCGDQSGDQTTNEQAGRLRAQAVENLLKKRGISGLRMRSTFVLKTTAPEEKRGVALEIDNHSRR
jgi:uncharacterized protein (DUF697 family)/outer membrane protein OmpA-like peptidoglycan-associated protein